jgi:Spy/CpxP family protein refolding chaperone
MPVNKTHIALALAAALLVSAPAVQAQEATPGYAEPQPGTAAIDNALIEQFAVAYASILEVQREFSQQLEQVTDNDEAQALQRQVQDEMIAVVEANDLSVQDYNAVVALMQQDPALRERIMQIVDSL